MNPPTPIPTVRTCRVRVLPETLVNKIAAGEVIERPASVVKELVENAMDAGSTRVTIHVEEGGKQLIRVTDNGGGMTAEELRLAVAAHATSKLASEDDLYHVRTYGFRGEALASIGAVSKLRIISRRAEEDEAHEVVVVGGRLESSKAASHPVGTTVEVHDLFFNTPARRRFLRMPAAEVGHVHEQVSRSALPRQDIAFDMTNAKRASLTLPRCDTRLERVAKFYGPELARALLSVSRNERGLGIEGYVAPPAQSRGTAQWQYTFVNGRYIRDRYLQHAIRESYRGLMEPSRHAVVFLFLTIDPEAIDVNVHPTKVELRWADANLVHSQVLSAMRETLRAADLAAPLRTDRARRETDEAEQQRMREELAAWFKSVRPASPVGSSAPADPANPASSMGDPGALSRGFAERAAAMGGSLPDALRAWEALYARPSTPSVESVVPPAVFPGVAHRQDVPVPPYVSARASDADASSVGPSRPRAVQMHNLYLVAETEEGILIVDQHALHERVMYEQLRSRMARGPLESQRLLLPETVNVTPRQLEALETNAELLQSLGVEATPFGADTVAVHAFPTLLKDAPVQPFLRDLLDKLADQPHMGAATDAALNDVLSMMACKAAVKAGDPLTPDEIESLMTQRHLLEKPSSCPHGRPTMLRLSKNDLNRQFHRT